MKPRTLLTAVLGLGFFTFGSAETKAKAGPEVLVTADINSDKPDTLRPSPDHPVYYYLIDQKEHTIGRSYAGEKMPERKMVEAEVEKALAGQGYVRTKVGGPKPDIMLMVIFGTANAAMDEIPGDDSGTNIIYNRREMTQLTGVPKENTPQAANAQLDERANQAMREDRLYVMLGAFDAEAMARKEKKMLWRTRMSVDALRAELPAVLPTMLASAAPYFGRALEAPQFVDDAARRNPTVNLGPLQVLEMDAAKTRPSEKPLAK